MNPLGLWARAFARVFERAIDLALDAAVGWVKWFWRLAPLPKFAALAAHVVAGYLVVTSLGLGASGITMVEDGAVLLFAVAISSLLFGSSRGGGGR